MHNVFVYGTLKSSSWNHRYLAEAEFICKATTQHKYVMRDIGIPILMPHVGGYPVRGELYEVDNATLARLDRLENHPTRYQRHLRPFHTHPLSTPLEAWTYEMAYEVDIENHPQAVKPTLTWP